MANNLSAIKFKRRISGAAPTAAQIQRGELFLHLGNRTIYTKNESDQVIELGVAGAGGTIGGDLTVNGKLTVNQNTELKGGLSAGGTTLIWLDVNQNLKVLGSAAITSSVSALNGQIKIAMKGPDPYIGFSEPNTMLRSNANGLLVIGAKSTDTQQRAIIFRPQGESAPGGESSIKTDGSFNIPGLNVANATVLKDLTTNGNVVTNGRFDSKGAFTVALGASFGSTVKSSGILTVGDGGERVQIHPGNNASVKFYGGNAIRSEIFGMTSGADALKIRPSGNSVNDYNFGMDGTLSSLALVVRNRLDVHATADTEWSAVNFKGGPGSSQKRGLVYADGNGSVGLSNANGRQIAWNNDNTCVIGTGSLTVGNWVANGEQQEPGAKSYFRNKDWMYLEGTNAWQDKDVGWVRQVNGFRMDLKRPNANWYSEDCLLQADGWGEVRRRFVVYADGAQSIFEMTHPGDLFVPRNVEANNVLIRSDRTVKSNIKSITAALDKVSTLDGSTYIDESNKLSAGLIAQDVQEVLPEAVIRDNKGLLRLNYNAVVGLLVNAVKELRQEVKELRGK
ncbi:putative long tail fiber protein [Serratia phage SP1]|nr:putative long tail fiber protein [Serratia phage SP1]